MELKRDLGIVQSAYGKSLKRFRVKAKYSQESLALRAGLNRTHMYKLEAGLTNPTLWTVVRICDVLGVSIQRFATELDKNMNPPGRKV